MIQLNITIDAIAVTTYLDDRLIALSDAGLAEILDLQILPYLQSRVANRFASSGDDATGPWAALSPKTIANRRAKGVYHDKPLIVSGQLMQYAIDPPGTFAAPEANYVVLEYPAWQPALTADRLGYKWGMAANGITNAFGMSIQVPARPILAVNEADISSILTILSKQVL